jgi:ABC-type multidrug transport system fused ATPase/permease subunit
MAINEVIAENFQDWTVLSIVHKLETTLECDKIVVLGKGRVLESGNPRHLLAREHSEFRRLYHMSIRGQM